MRFDNEQKPCIICKEESFLRTDEDNPLCPVHFIIYAIIDEVTDGTGTENLLLEENTVASQAHST